MSTPTSPIQLDILSDILTMTLEERAREHAFRVKLIHDILGSMKPWERRHYLETMEPEARAKLCDLMM